MHPRFLFSFLVLSCAAAMLTAQEAAPQAAPPVATAEHAADKLPDAPPPEAGGKLTPGGGKVDPKAYVIGPEDVLRLVVWRQPDLSGYIDVRPDGMISMPLIGEIKAAGLTPEQLKDVVTEKLKESIKHPEVTISLARVLSKKFYIQGEVNKPGAYPLVVQTTVLEALVNAGGFRDFANPKKIYILRGTEKLKFNYNEVRNGKKMEQNIVVQNGDQIFVP